MRVRKDQEKQRRGEEELGIANRESSGFGNALFFLRKEKSAQTADLGLDIHVDIYLDGRFARSVAGLPN